MGFFTFTEQLFACEEDVDCGVNTKGLMETTVTWKTNREDITNLSSEPLEKEGP